MIKVWFDDSTFIYEFDDPGEAIWFARGHNICGFTVYRVADGVILAQSK